MSREGTGSGEMSELRTAAIVVWHFQRMEGKEAWAAAMETRAEQSRRVEQFRTELTRIVGERDDYSFRINGGCVEAEVEDLHFIALEVMTSDKQQGTLVSLLGRCPSCGVETASEPIRSFAELGKMLESFEPCYQHTCYA
jgi:hypothetical protein